MDLTQCIDKKARTSLSKCVFESKILVFHLKMENKEMHTFSLLTDDWW